MTIQSKADRDRVRGRAGINKRLLEEARRILREYRQGRAASACMADLERLMQHGSKEANG